MNYQKLAKQAFDKIKSKKFSEAKADLNKLLKKFPINTDFLNALAFVETNLNNINNSATLLKKSISINKNQPETLRNLALNLIQKKDYKDAQNYSNIGLELFPEDNLFYFINGIIFSSLDNSKEAIKSYKDSLKINPNFTKAYLNLGFILNKNKDYLGAIKIYKKLLDLEPNNHDAHYNLAISYDNQGEGKKSKYHYEETLRLNPQNDVAKFNLSVLDLLLMNFSEGWKLYEWRWYALEKPPFAREIPDCLELNKNERLLLWGEQGIGEQIIYTSMLCSLKDFNNITVAIDPRLIPIYHRSFKNIKFVERQKHYDKNEYDSQLALGSLGGFLRPNKKSFENQQQNFLYADSKKVSLFRNKFKSKNKLLCGISWKSKNEKIGNEKSLDLEELIPKLNLDKFDFVDLQYGDTVEDREKIYKKHKILIKNHQDLDKFNDLDGLLALIDACDVVITVSNATAHMAGSLGKKTFMLAPHVFGLIWHWHIGSKSLWYPSIKILRKSIDNSWEEPIKKLAHDLNSLIS